MKHIFFIFACLLPLINFAQEKTPVNTKIEAVTVYLNGAQVTRSFSANLQKGKNYLVVDGLPSDVKETSFKVAPISKSVKVLSINTEINYLTKENLSGKITEIQNKLELERKEMNKKSSLLQVFIEEEQLLKQNKSIGGQQNGMTVDELKALAAYFHERLSEIALQKIIIQEKIQEHQEKINQYQSQLSEWSSRRPQPKRNLVILAEANSVTTSSFSIDYTVNSAGWTPSYDIRAEKVNQPVEVTYLANVYQNTGEDWKNVKLTFSNADPSQSGLVPSLNTWWLGFNRRYQVQQNLSNDRVVGRVLSTQGEPLPGVNVVIKGTTVGTVTDINGFYELPLTNDAQQIVYSFIGLSTQEVAINSRNEINVRLHEDVTQLSEVVVSGYARGIRSRKSKSEASEYDMEAEDAAYEGDISATSVVNQTTFEFQVKEPFTINSNNQRERIDLVAYDIPSIYKYLSVPKASESAFLTAKMTDWEDYNFLSGEASLFFEGKYIGKTVIDSRYAKDTLQLSLGHDKSVSINRKKIDDYSSKPFIGMNRKELVGYVIIVKNNKSEAIDITVEDQVPVSISDEIEVEIKEISNAEHNASTGKLVWRIKLDPGESKELTFKYEVKYPKNRVVYLE